MLATAQFSNAVAAEGSQQDEINVTVKTAGYTTGVQTPTLDRQVYVAGDEAILSWSGISDGDDFVIPTEIRYGNQVIKVDKLHSVQEFQTLNLEFMRRMGTYQTMSDHDSLYAYFCKNHEISLGKLTLDTEITVTYMRVSPVYRLYNMITSEHLFTTNKAEYDDFVEQGYINADAWIGEGVNWLAPITSTTKITRLYNAALGAMARSSHYYTKNESEIASLTKNGWVAEDAINLYSAGDVSIWTC